MEAGALNWFGFEWPHDAPANVEADALAGIDVDLEDGVVVVVSHRLRVRVDEPGLLDGV